MIRLAVGDLLATPWLDAIGHGCNTRGVMGAGFAKELRQRFPAMFTEYRRRCHAQTFVLGDVLVWATTPIVFNLATQVAPGPNAQLGAVHQALKTTLRLCAGLNVASLGLPRIGAGLGGLPWKNVLTEIHAVAHTTPIAIWVCSTYVRGKPLQEVQTDDQNTDT